ncbi:type I-E CRISPR-associated protein Cas5/CasD [Gluconacetobacter takamatsuzukensis]|uniref:Type I-E CRISPR-associated protein Cas5/CasD n=1 Tax=Gluconacetobacter takamatsuzukensis TaxID=1286190 RepID=A0A7W4KAR0_9PROT|nr:type I-E CRISPR-associated protein Cas5/CasD [Gluconacetobacter takamatsuzukensis]MBB2203479.1 type I-E CRISPR-associated protein Cas5/CasD [Gluconacetobacter takamatsuzukensis]
MTHFLTFAMVAPVASFGALAVGERREGWDRPARSGVLGLVAACLGLTREDEAAQSALATQYGLALLCHAPGEPMTDYHTTQTAPARRGWRPATRAQELSGPAEGLATILSRRDYRTGAWHLGALWVQADAPCWTLEIIAAAMAAPVFTPSLGRRSCPLGLPLAPVLVSGEAAAEVLMDRYDTGPEARLRVHGGSFREQLAGRVRARGGRPLLVLDAADVARQGGGARVLRREVRRDQPISRTRWQFALREEAVLMPGVKGEA